MQQNINTLLDPVVNFGKVTVFTGYTNVDTVIVLTLGQGAKLPNPSTDGQFNLVWYNSSKYADLSDDPNVEIVRCTDRLTDVLVVIRGQEGTAPSSKNSPGDTYRMILSQTKKNVSDMQADVQSKVNTHAVVTTGVHNFDASGNAPAQTHNNTRHGETYLTAADNIIAKSLKSATTSIDVSAATAPSTNQVLTATSSTTANWQTLSSIPGTIPTGTVLPYAGTTAPSGYLLCNGTAVSRTTYATLFSVISTTYGVGNNVTTFNVPDFLGRTIIGAGSGSGLTTRVIGTKGGEESHVLTVAELATHSHDGVLNDFSGMTPTGLYTNRVGHAGSTANAGSNAAHNNMQPFGVANYIIKT